MTKPSTYDRPRPFLATPMGDAKGHPHAEGTQGPHNP